MTVLLTGGSGFIGKQVFWTLRSLGFDVICWDRKTGQDIVKMSVPIVDAVVHLAANLHDNFQDNYFATQHLIEQQDNFQQFIFVSSAAVYGDAMNAEEDGPVNPFGEYGKTKYREEVLVRSLKMPYTILRLANVYGPATDHGVYNYFINGGLNINGDGGQVRDFVHVEDVVMSIVHSLLTYSWEGTFNIGSGVPITINKLFTLINPNKSPIYKEAKEEIQCSCLNIEKAKHYGYAPRHIRS